MCVRQVYLGAFQAMQDGTKRQLYGPGTESQLYGPRRGHCQRLLHYHVRRHAQKPAPWESAM